MKLSVGFLVLAVSFAIVAPVRAESPPSDNSPIGKEIKGFTLRDCFGKERTLGELQDSRLVVVAFLGTECPLAKLYGPRLESLHKKYMGKEVAFVGINANTQDTITELALYRERHGIAFPLLKDLGNVVADDFGAVRTPEVFVLDKGRSIRYWGRIDDQYDIGIQRDAPKTHHLADALDELLAGREVSTPVTESIGCHIGRVQKIKPHGDITYSKHIAAIFNRRCVECHRAGEIAPFELIQNGANECGSGCTHRMAHRDSTTIDVHLIPVGSRLP